LIVAFYFVTHISIRCRVCKRALFLSPNPTFIFEARFTPESKIYRVRRDMRNCRVSKNVQYGCSCRYTALSYPK